MKKRLLLLILVLLCLNFVKNTVSQSTDKIVYLNLKYVSEKVSLAKLKIVKGKLKKPKKIMLTNDHIYYSVLDSQDEVLFEGQILDPSKKIYEYEDRQGQMRTKVVAMDSVNFFVRVPYHPSVYKMNFQKIQKWSLLGLTLMKRKKTIGSFFINLDGENHGN